MHVGTDKIKTHVIQYCMHLWILNIYTHMKPGLLARLGDIGQLLLSTHQFSATGFVFLLAIKILLLHGLEQVERLFILQLLLLYGNVKSRHTVASLQNQMNRVCAFGYILGCTGVNNVLCIVQLH